jgi:hypothetical protein
LLSSPHAWTLALSSQEAIKAKLGTISQEAQSKLEEDTAKKEAKAEAKADAARKKKLVRSQNLIESPLADYFQGVSSRFRSHRLSPLAFLFHFRLSSNG